MNRKILLLDLILVALAAALAWQIRVRWMEGQAREHAIFINAAHARALLHPPAVAPPKAVTAAEYIEVAQKMLFAKDRNPNVVLPPPPAPPPKPPLPALPMYFGQMALGDPVVFLATNAGEQKSYHKGEKVGPFELVAFDRDKITFAWNGETVERPIEDLRPKEAAAVEPQAQRRPNNSPPAAAAPANSGSPLKSIGAASDSASSASDPAKSAFGVDVGGGIFGCKPGDNSPSGTVVGNYKKTIARGLMGETCHWEQIK